MNQLWQYWKQGLSNEFCDAIISKGLEFPVSNPSLGFDGTSENRDFRSSEIRWIPYMDPSCDVIVKHLWHFTNEANKNAFGFDLAYLNEIQFTTYHADQNGKYDWHYDTFWANPTAFDRKLSVVVQLSDPSEYDGGDFEIDYQLPQLPRDDIRTRGTVIVFPSFLHHRVTPVTRGIRRSLVTWIQGPKFR